jgi:hypothetical protein
MQYILHEITKRKTNRIGHILCRNCLLQQVIEGNVKGRIEVTGRRRRRRRKLLDDLKERTGYLHPKEEALDHSMWRARFGPVVRQTATWMNKMRWEWRTGSLCSASNSFFSQFCFCLEQFKIPPPPLNFCVQSEDHKWHAINPHLSPRQTTHEDPPPLALNKTCIERAPLKQRVVDQSLCYGLWISVQKCYPLSQVFYIWNRFFHP